MPYGTLLTDTIKSSISGPVTFQNTSGTEVGTLCRAWVNFNGTTSPGTIRAAFNVSSVTKNSSGNYNVNFTTAFSDTNYCVTGAAKYLASATGQNLRIGTQAYGTAVTTTAVIVNVTSAGNASETDAEMVNVAIFR